jgi:hypothetical protein
MEKSEFLTVFAILILLVPSAVVRSETYPPTFSDFPIKQQSIAKIAQPDVSRGRAHSFRTRLREGATQGPNFAGHYTVVLWGCGTDCIEFAIVDTIDGDVYFPPFPTVESVIRHDDKDHPTVIPKKVEFRLDSRLLIVWGVIDKNDLHTHYFEWTGKELRGLESWGR